MQMSFLANLAENNLFSQGNKVIELRKCAA